MDELNEEQLLADIIAQDERYARPAYLFVLEALQFTIKRLNRQSTPDNPDGRHITGRELLEGIRDLAKQEFGMLARCVLHEWGINKTDDFGEIVFSMVERGMLGKTERDSRADFKNVFDFSEAFADYQVQISSK